MLITETGILTPLDGKLALLIVVKQMLYSWMIDGYKLLKSSSKMCLS